MNTTTLFRLLLGLGLLLSAAPSRATAATHEPRPTASSARAAQLTDYLTQSLALAPAQVPPVGAAVARRVRATDGLSHRHFGSSAARSAAYTIVEYEFYNELTAALTASQFSAFLQLDDQLLAVR